LNLVEIIGAECKNGENVKILRWTVEKVYNSPRNQIQQCRGSMGSDATIFKDIITFSDAK